MKFTIESNLMAAVMASVNVDERRPELRGWYVDAEASKVIATTGYILVAAPIRVIDADDPPPVGTAFRPIKVTKTKAPHDLVIDTETSRVSGRKSEQQDLVITHEGRTGMRPEQWNRILHAERRPVSRPAFAFDPLLLQGIAKALSTSEETASVTMEFSAPLNEAKPTEHDLTRVKLTWRGTPGAHNLECIFMGCLL